MKIAKYSSAVFSITVILLFISVIIFAENLEIAGSMYSTIKYEVRQRISGCDEAKILKLSFVIPQDFRSPFYRQSVYSYDLKFFPEPDHKKKVIDARGNKIIISIWKKPPVVIDVNMKAIVKIDVELEELSSNSYFPMRGIPREVKAYTMPSELIQAGNKGIIELAKKLTKRANTTRGAVIRILRWMAKNIAFLSGSKNNDAVSVLRRREGNCNSFSHLSAALLRASGVPVRIVNGIVFARPFDIYEEHGRKLIFNMPGGRHSWIEVWFEDYGWIPCDPQKTESFIPGRYVRIEIGIDNAETKKDGLLRWIQKNDGSQDIRRIEILRSDFLEDLVELFVVRSLPGSGKLILSPPLRSM